MYFLNALATVILYYRSSYNISTLRSFILHQQVIVCGSVLYQVNPDPTSKFTQCINQQVGTYFLQWLIMYNAQPFPQQIFFKIITLSGQHEIGNNELIDSTVC